MSNHLVPDEAVAAVTKVLVAHQRRDNSSCLCGWARLGFSHPTHQAALVLEAAAPHIAARALTDAVDAFPLETITAPDNAVVWLMRRVEQIENEV
jgi:hypothetical protein